MDWRTHITVDPNVCHGKACIQGTRVLVTVVLDSLAEGRSPEQIVKDYPSIRVEHVHAALAYAAELARERLVALPT